MAVVADGDLVQVRGGFILRWPRQGVPASDVLRVLGADDLAWLRVRQEQCASRGLIDEAEWVSQVIAEIEARGR